MANIKFDGAPLYLNDTVYDVSKGAGVVVEILRDQKSFRVKFGQKTFMYTLDGQSFEPRKTLYWRNPIGRYYPRKDDKKWDTFVVLVDAIAHGLDIVEIKDEQ